MGLIVGTHARLIKYVVVCGLIAGCLVVVFLGKPAMASRLEAWKVLPRPERFTELYFGQQTRQPETFQPDDVQVISFTVHNLEQRGTDYRYVIAAHAGDKVQVLALGQLRLDQDTSQSIEQAVSVPPLGSRVEIRVQLEFQGIARGQDTASLETQSIHYWVNRAT